MMPARFGDTAMTGGGAEQRERLIGWSVGLVVVVLWGLSFVATRVALRDIGPMTLAFLRFAMAVLVLWPFVRRTLGRVKPTRQDRRDLFLMGFLGVTLAFVLENYGLERTTASHAALLISVAPIATALTEAVMARRVPARRVILGLLLAFGGVVLIVGQDDSGDATLLGDALILATVAIWVVYGFLTKRLTREHPVGWVTGVALLWGAATLLPLAAWETWRLGWTPPSPWAWASLIFLGIFCSALAYLWWNRAIAILGVTTTNSLIYGMPLVAVIGGVLILDEPLTPEVLAGGALIIVGLVLSNMRRAGRPAA
jgi:drug/metabolite transporter (DMT)-like permease